MYPILSPKTGEPLSGSAFVSIPAGNPLYDRLILLAGLFWCAAYVLIIYRGFKDKSCGMPLLVLCINMAWEFVYGFLGHLSAQPPSMRLVSAAWFVLDCAIVWLYFRYGRKEFRRALPHAPEKGFVPMVLLLFGMAFALVYLSVFEWNDHTGVYIAYMDDALISILFVVMLMRRGNADGQSMWIGLCKFVGTLFTIALGGAVVRTEYGVNRYILADIHFMPLMKLFIVLIILFNVVYLVMLYRTLKYKLGLNPWTRRPLDA